MSRLYLPAPDPVTYESEWVRAVGGKWQEGRSAHALAHTWYSAQGFPLEVEDALAKVPRFTALEPMVVLGEHQVPLRGRGPASHNDLLVIARRSGGELVVIAVEGKVDEAFGEATVAEWLKVESPNRGPRIEHVCSVLGVELGSALDDVRYQLLHRTASAVIEADRFKAPDAVMLVHSFSEEHTWFEDFVGLAKALGAATPERGAVVPAKSCGNVALSIGWVPGRLP